LALIVPHRFYVTGQARSGDKHLYASRTRFIPAGILGQFEVRAWPSAARATGPTGASPPTTVDLPARMRGQWLKSGS
jgi:DNA helicase-2/ATP-dependent DNA helicase PcrA